MLILDDYVLVDIIDLFDCVVYDVVWIYFDFDVLLVLLLICIIVGLLVGLCLVVDNVIVNVVKYGGVILV